jgi:uncharacterized protein (DUF302 family)
MTARSWVLAGILALAGTSLAGFAAEGIEVATAPGKFDEVKESVALAIEGRGLVINSVSKVGEMLDRTGADLGAARKIYDNAEVFEFCSAKVSRQMMEATPQNLVYCPYTIAVYTVPGQPGKVFVAYRKPPPGPAFAPVESLLKEIVGEAAR